MSDTPKIILPTRTSEDMADLFENFGQHEASVPSACVLATSQVPEPFRSLLSHENHMTVTLEEHIGGPVKVHVLEEARNENQYARKSLLTDAATGKVVQFGILRFNFDHCRDEVRDRILEGNTPLGRILIEHDVLRRISTHALLRINPNEEIMTHFGLTEITPVYGRLATIFCNEEPAVDLLEIVSPAN